MAFWHLSILSVWYFTTKYCNIFFVSRYYGTNDTLNRCEALDLI
jgi:hypothetical protein